MDNKIEIKEEDPVSEHVALQNEIQFFTSVVSMKTNSDDMLLDDCDLTIKTETPFTDFCLKKERECLTKPFLKTIKSETITSSNNCEINIKTEIEQCLVSDFGSENEREFLSDDPVMKVQKYHIDHEVDNQIEIKEEPWWLEMETSSVCYDIKDDKFPAVKSSRLCTKAVSGDSKSKSLLPSTEVSRAETSFINAKHHLELEGKESNIRGIPTGERHSDPEQPDECNDREQMYSSASLYLKPKKFMHEAKKSQRATICEKRLAKFPSLETDILIHVGKKLHQCKTCDKSFTCSSNLKTHILIHEGKKPYQCKNCVKSFTCLSNLKRHNLIHEGNKPHQCKTCDKSFTQLSHLKSHILIHEGKKPYQCKTCDKSFTQLSHLKSHNLIHEGKKLHQCKTCDKSFTCLSNLKTHLLIHEGKKPYECKTCDKSFTQLAHLKTHNLIHEGKKLHQCKTCDKSFTHFSNLKAHNLIHEGKKPYQCKICGKSFSRLSNLKTHILIHKSKKSY